MDSRFRGNDDKNHRGRFHFKRRRAKKTIGDDYNVDLQDTLNTKQALNRLGYYQPPECYGMIQYPDMLMFKALKAFQKDQGLKVDGLMKPGGPTEAAIGLQLAINQQGRQSPPDKHRDPDAPPYNPNLTGNSSACELPRGWTRTGDGQVADKNGSYHTCNEGGF